MDQALHDAETKLRELGRREEANAAAAAPSESVNDAVVAELREQASRARERAANLEELLDEKTRANRRLEREVAEAVDLGVSSRMFCRVELLLLRPTAPPCRGAIVIFHPLHSQR